MGKNLSVAEKEARGRLIEQAKEAREVMRKHIDEKKRLNDQFAKLREELKKKTGEVQEAKDKLPFRTISEMENRVSQLEAQIESGQFKLIEEKQILAEISKLKKMRRALESIDGNSSDVGTMKLRMDKLRTQISEKDDAINGAKARLDEINKKIDEMNGSRAEAQAARQDRNATIDRLKKELDKLYQERRAAYEEYRAAKKAQFEAREKREAKRAEYERRRELEDKLEELEEKLLAFNPETATDRKISECNNLRAFFAELTGMETSSAINTTDAAVSKAAEGIRQVKLSSDLADAEVIRKEDDDYFFAPKKKNSNANKVMAGTSSAVPATSVAMSSNTSLAKKMPYHIISALADLSLPIPSTVGDVPALFKAIDAKKETFLNKQDDAAGEMEKKRAVLKEQIENLKKELEKPIKIEKKTSSENETTNEEKAEADAEN